jgi:hypothetical protein
VKFKSVFPELCLEQPDAPSVTVLKDSGQRSGVIRKRKVPAAKAPIQENLRQDGELGQGRTWIETGFRTVIGLASVFLLLVVARLFDRIK